jgi:NAD(P)-dependent dehydrogenase (short-subunit alcohol dehydrogenase family)
MGVMDVNLYGLIRVTRAFLPLLRKSAPDGYTSIINVTSIAGSNATFADVDKNMARAIAYRASKVSVNMYTIALSHELKDERIRVNAITPGLTATKFSGGRGTPVGEAVKVFIPYALMEKDDMRTGIFPFWIICRVIALPSFLTDPTQGSILASKGTFRGRRDNG